MLTGKNDEEKIWNYLISSGLNPYGVAGLMGNLYAESELRPNNLQNSYEGKLGYRDAEYTEMVDNGTYTNFVNDKAGYYTLSDGLKWLYIQVTYNRVTYTGFCSSEWLSK